MIARVWFHIPLLAIICACSWVATPGVSAAPAADPRLGVPVRTGAGCQRLRCAISDGASGAILAWLESPGLWDSYLRFQRIDSLGVGRWGAGGRELPGERARTSEYSPQMVSDDAGGAIVLSDFVRGQERDLVVQRLNGDGEAQWGHEGVLLSDVGWTEHSMLADGEGGAFVVRASRWWIPMAQHLSPDGVRLWGREGVSLGPSVSFGETTDLASDGCGGLIAVWRRVEHGSENSFEIRAQRVAKNGTLRWGNDGVALSKAVPGLRRLMTAPDGAGGANVVWQESRDDSCFRLRALHIGPDGIPERGWEKDVVGACRYLDPYLTASSDAHAGVVLAWIESSPPGPGARASILAQRLDASGRPLWAKGGEPVCTAPSWRACPSVAADGDGGAFVTWADARLRLPRTVGEDTLGVIYGMAVHRNRGWFRNVYGLYAQHLDAHGAALWARDGIAIRDSSANASPAALVPSSGGGAIVAWSDARGDGAELYARVIRPLAGDSVRDDVAGAARPQLALGRVAPNPAHGSVTLRFSLSRKGEVALAIYDVAGRLVRQLARGTAEPGDHAARWDGNDGAGNTARSGVYFVQLRAEGRMLVTRLVLLR